MYSLYFAVTAFTGLGDGDFYSASPAEATCVILFMLCNVVLSAYCLGEFSMDNVKRGGDVNLNLEIPPAPGYHGGYHGIAIYHGISVILVFT